MKCPHCRDADLKTYDTRPQEDGSVKRRRRCDKCGRKYLTKEALAVQKWRPEFEFKT